MITAGTEVNDDDVRYSVTTTIYQSMGWLDRWHTEFYKHTVQVVTEILQIKQSWKQYIYVDYKYSIGPG